MAAGLEKITQATKRYAKAASQVLPVNQVVLFGSHAKGTATNLSDVDVCFFLDSYEGKTRWEILTELLGLTHGFDDVFFEPAVFPSSELENDNPFVNEVMRTGQVLYQKAD